MCKIWKESQASAFIPVGLHGAAGECVCMQGTRGEAAGVLQMGSRAQIEVLANSREEARRRKRDL